MLGTADDKVIARKLGRSRGAVTSQRVKRKIPAHSGSLGGGKAWDAEEIALLGAGTDAAVARRIGRTASAVSQKQAALMAPATHS